MTSISSTTPPVLPSMQAMSAQMTSVLQQFEQALQSGDVGSSQSSSSQSGGFGEAFMLDIGGNASGSGVATAAGDGSGSFEMMMSYTSSGAPGGITGSGVADVDNTIFGIGMFSLPNSSSASTTDGSDASSTTAAAGSSGTGVDSGSSDTSPDAIIQMMEQMMASLQAFLQGGTTTADGSTDTSGTTQSAAATPGVTSATAADTGTASDASSTTASSRAERFLNRLENNPNLTDAQKQTVQGLITQYQSAPSTSDTFNAIRTALQQAGIGPQSSSAASATTADTGSTPTA